MPATGVAGSNQRAGPADASTELATPLFIATSAAAGVAVAGQEDPFAVGGDRGGVVVLGAVDVGAEVEGVAPAFAEPAGGPDVVLPDAAGAVGDEEEVL